MGICTSSASTPVTETSGSGGGSIGGGGGGGSGTGGAASLPPMPPVWYRFSAQGEDIDPRTFPLCTLCEMNKLQDGKHFLVECPSLEKYRRDFLGQSTKRWSDWSALTLPERYERLVTDSDSEVIKLLRQFYTKSSQKLSPAAKIHVSEKLLDLCEKLREPLH